MRQKEEDVSSAFPKESSDHQDKYLKPLDGKGTRQQHLEGEEISEGWLVAHLCRLSPEFLGSRLQ